MDATYGLIVKPGKTLALVGGNVAIEAGKLEAAGGRIELGGLASAGTVGLVVDGNNLSLGFADNVTRADILLTNEATVSVEADGGGSITVNARNLDVSGGSRLSAGIRQGLGSVNSVAGDIRLNATERIKVVGSSVFNNVQSQSAYNGGDILISAGSLSLTNGARLEANTFGSGDAGNVLVNASDSVSLANAAILSTVKSGAAGDAGNVVISAGSLSLTNGARLEANTFGSGNAGNVLVNASDFVSLKDGAQLSTSSFGLGSAGDLKIAARSILLENNADVKSEALGGGSGGNISLDQRILLLSRNSKVSVNAGGTGEVGVSRNSFNFGLPIVAATMTSQGVGERTSQGVGGNAGNISINSNALVFTDETTEITAISSNGSGGIIGINAQIILSPYTKTSVLNFPSLSNLIVDTSKLIAGTSCGAIASTDADTDKSKFTITGRGGLPPNPYEPLSADVIWSDTRLASATSQYRSEKPSTKPATKDDAVKIVPATGWVFDGKGHVTLISHASNANNLGSTPACQRR